MAKSKGSNARRRKVNPLSKRSKAQRKRRLKEKLAAIRVEIESPSSSNAVLENLVLHNQENVTNNPGPPPAARSSSIIYENSNVKIEQDNDTDDPELLSIAIPSSSASQSHNLKIEQNEFFYDQETPMPNYLNIGRNGFLYNPEQHVPSSSNRHSQNSNTAPKNHLRQNRNQNKINYADYPPRNDESAKKCTESITKFLATSLQPFTLVEEDPFKEMIKTFNPQYCIPQRKYFSDTAIPKLYNEGVDKLKEILANGISAEEFFSITCDSWNSDAGHLYMAISVHYVNTSWDLISACLSCPYFEENYTAVNVKHTIRNKLVEWGLTQNFIVACTSDNGNNANIENGMNLLNINYVRCFAHCLTLGVNRAMEIFQLQKAIKSLKTLQNAIAHSWDMKWDFREAQELLEYDVKKIPTAYLTRWLSVFKLCQRFLENRTPIFKMLQNFPEHTMPDMYEICTLEAFVEVASVLQGITEKLNSENYASSSVVLPLLLQLQSDISIQREDGILLSNIKDRILRVLTCYEREPLQTTLRCSTFMDPRFKLNCFLDMKLKNVIKAVVISEVEELYNSSFISDISKPSLPKERAGLSAEYHNTNNSKERAYKEVQDYLYLPVIDMDANPLQWWHDFELNFPKLSILAKKYLCIQGSCLPSERIFSTRENVIDKIRCSLSPKTAEMQIFLAYNKRVLGI